MTRTWIGEVAAATTPGPCQWYVTARTFDRRPGATCKRPGTTALTVGNGIPAGPYCRQHGLVAQDRATARLLHTSVTVRLEAIR
jgi:hypothetical protein